MVHLYIKMAAPDLDDVVASVTGLPDAQEVGFREPMMGGRAEDEFGLGQMADRWKSSADNRVKMLDHAYLTLKSSNYLPHAQLFAAGLSREVAFYKRQGSLWTFLHQACYWNNHAIARTLLEWGADVMAVSADGLTPEDVSRQRDATACALLLLDYIQTRPKLAEMRQKRRA